MLQTMFNLFLATFISVMILVTASILSSRSMLNQETPSPYECGFDPKQSARIPFSTRFFILAVLFLVFDLEIILLLPIPLTHTSWFVPTMISSFGFLIILTLGLIHEWHEGSLDWIT